MKNIRNYYLILLLPIIDLLTSIQTRFMPGSLSIGIISKMLLIALAVYYIFFKSASKYKKSSIVFVLVIFGYILCYFIFKPELLSINYLVNECKYIFKIIYFPIMFFALLNYFDEYGLNKQVFIKCLFLTLLEYTILLLIPIIFNLSFNSYSYILSGTIGWFYAANEISVIMLLLYPSIYYLLNSKKKILIILVLPILYAIASIGTKVTLFGTLIISIITLIIILTSQKGKITKTVFNTFIILLFTIIIFFGVKNTTINNMNQIYDNYNYNFNDQLDVPNTSLNNELIDSDNNISINNEINNQTNPKDSNTIFNQILKYLLSSRDIYYQTTKDIYIETFEPDYIFFGMGFTNTSKINNNNISKLIEIDILDLYFHTGFISIIISIFPLLFMLIKIIQYLFINRRKKEIIINSSMIYYLFIIILIIGVSTIAGHVLFAPSVSFYLALYILLTLNSINIFEKEKIDNNKISILALHLNYGGVENVLTNQANMLADNYNVEIISLYKSEEPIPFYIKNNVKITYLMNEISNREKLKEAIKKKNIQKFIKETFKALKILYLKPLLIKKAIINSDAKIIISTRAEFSKILGKNRRDNIITISEEHNHHNNDVKYIKKVIKSNNNIDYLFPVSKELTDFYKEKVKSKVVYIPNSLNFFPSKLNKLNTKNIVAIGRLSLEKGFIDLIDVMKEVNKVDKEIVLDIYGDGMERNTIIKKIKEYNLNNNIQLKGFVSPQKLQKYLEKYTLILIPSYKESFGLVALEAMSYGIPVIMYDTAKGPLELVNKDNGVVIKNRDTKKMAQEIVKLSNNKDELIRLGGNGRKKSEEYSFDKIKITLNNFIEQILK